MSEQGTVYIPDVNTEKVRARRGVMACFYGQEPLAITMIICMLDLPRIHVIEACYDLVASEELRICGETAAGATQFERTDRWGDE